MAAEYRLPYTAQEFEEKLDKLKDADQAYNPDSENAQSGFAVAAAINAIPQADWQQNEETASDYIKNRPGGYNTLTEILPETTLNFTSGPYLTLTNCPLKEVGNKYIVTFDNTEYELVSRSDSGGRGLICIGNEEHTWGGGPDTTTPFIIFNNEDNADIYISSSETLPCTHNIKIKTMVPIKIDNKYLDIKNTNIVNGSSPGSLRTVNSAEEYPGKYDIGPSAFAEGYGTKASGRASHAEGDGTIASGGRSHAEGYVTKASGSRSHAEGNSTIASGSMSHAEGNGTEASGNYSHAEGDGTIASGSTSHAEGNGTKASGNYSHAEGNSTIASSGHQHVQGKYNIADSNNIYADIIGNGISDTGRSNAATVDWNGNAWYAGAATSNGADYAEFFEWLDGNQDNEDRVGYLVALDGDKIRFANPEDEVLGTISANPAILGDNYECNWNGKYLTDEFGRILYDKVEEFIDIPKVDKETGKTTIEKKSLGFFDHPRINPEYNPEQEYINRRDRSEWAMVGMLGKLLVRDDGTAQINGYVTAGENGIATASVEKTNIRVLSRINDHIIKVLLK